MTFDYCRTRLGDICIFKAGNAIAKDLQGVNSGAFPVVKVSDMNLPGNELYIRRANNWLSSETATDGFVLHEANAVIFAKIGVALTSNRRRILTRSTVLDNNMMSATCVDGVDNRWFYFLLCTLDFNEVSVGSALPYLTVRDLSAVEVPLPPLHEQKAIAAILGALDDKIELNRRMNKTLEGLARAIFKSWFVDFDPVRAKQEARSGATGNKNAGRDTGLSPNIAALFPDRFGEDGLPEGWLFQPLSEATSELRRGLAPKYIESGGVCVLNQRCIRDRIVSTELSRRHDPDARSISGRELHPGDILVNSTGVGTLGRVAQIWKLREQTIVDSHVTVVRPDVAVSSLYLGQNLLAREAEIEVLGHGSTGQTELSQDRLGALPVCIPGQPVQKAFESAVRPILDRTIANQEESQILAALRDLLLPKLMSGEVRIGDAEKLAGEAGA